jgi:LAO/AO transport system ATPase
MPDGDVAADLLASVGSGDRRALGQAISALEDRSALGAALSAEMASVARRAYVVGVTGPPGAGKSTLLSALSTELVSVGRRVAILLIDPSSPVTGGAVLGDRIRFHAGSSSTSLLVRSLANRGHPGGVTEMTDDITRLLSVAGFDTVLIETVGTGQSDVAITSVADATICTTPPGLGDGIQSLKAGIQELADIFVVTKADRPDAPQAISMLRAVATRVGDSSPRPVIATSSIEGSGISDLLEVVETLRNSWAALPPEDVGAATVPRSNPAATVLATFDLSGKTAIVTGGTSGLGNRFARVLHSAGARVIVVGRRTGPLESLAEELGERIVPVRGDVTDDDDCARVVEVAGPVVDILVNNAGMGDVAKAESESLAEFRSVIDVNLIAVFNLSQRCGRLMLARGSGSIINIASALGQVASSPIPQAGYCASKAGVINLTRELAAQWSRQGVRVNALAPGWFPSEMTEEMFGHAQGSDYIARNTPIGRPGRIEELDGALLFLASTSSSYVVGQTLAVDGGWTIR